MGAIEITDVKFAGGKLHDAEWKGHGTPRYGYADAKHEHVIPDEVMEALRYRFSTDARALPSAWRINWQAKRFEHDSDR